MDNKPYRQEIPEEERIRMAKKLEMLVAEQTARRQLELKAQIEWEYEIDFGQLKRETELAKKQAAESAACLEELLLRTQAERLRAEAERQMRELSEKKMTRYQRGFVLYRHLSGSTQEQIARLTDLSLGEIEQIIR